MTTPTPTTRNRRRTVAPWLIHAVLAAQLGLAGATRLPGTYRDLVGRVDAAGADLWFRYTAGSLDVAGALGAIVPCLTAVAALGLVAVVAVAGLTHLAGQLTGARLRLTGQHGGSHKRPLTGAWHLKSSPVAPRPVGPRPGSGRPARAAAAPVAERPGYF